ncbi:MAG: hypothetical protein K1X75_03925 [Leptospirales bacterium]|nr:hypothetical protein [Leptospirales bacterium]
MSKLPAIVLQAWQELGDDRQIESWQEVSANVSTNQVYRLLLSDQSSLVVKTSSYGSYYLFLEDHLRIGLWRDSLQQTRFRSLLADSLHKDGRLFSATSGDVWAIFYHEAPQRERLPAILDQAQIVNLAEEMAYFHKECRIVAPQIPLTSKSIKSDIVQLLENLRSPAYVQQLGFDQQAAQLTQDHCRRFLDALLELGYDFWQRIPVLIDWNIGNFSITPGVGRFRLFSRWDYDWFRMEPPLLDFYFCSRVASAIGDRTVFSYLPDVLLEPRFELFLQTYHAISPLSQKDILFMRECYRLFILHYVIRQGAHFFKPSYCERLRREAVQLYLPRLEQLDFLPLWQRLEAAAEY